MFSETDLKQIATRGITPEQVEHQLNQIASGFPFLRLDSAAAIGNGILAPSDEERKQFIEAWNTYKAEGHDVVKFVPASGAASRMFKNLFAFVDAPYDVPTSDFEKHFFANIESFAFYSALDAKCVELKGKGIPQLIKDGNYKAVVATLLHEDGLNYGQLPKGLLLFHHYADGERTPMEEHLVEGALYAASNGVAKVHYTVSHSHMALFKNVLKLQWRSMLSALA